MKHLSAFSRDSYQAGIDDDINALARSLHGAASLSKAAHSNQED